MPVSCPLSYISIYAHKRADTQAVLFSLRIHSVNVIYTLASISALLYSSFFTISFINSSLLKSDNLNISSGFIPSCLLISFTLLPSSMSFFTIAFIGSRRCVPRALLCVIVPYISSDSSECATITTGTLPPSLVLYLLTQ